VRPECLILAGIRRRAAGVALLKPSIAVLNPSLVVREPKRCGFGPEHCGSEPHCFGSRPKQCGSEPECFGSGPKRLGSGTRMRRNGAKTDQYRPRRQSSRGHQLAMGASAFPSSRRVPGTSSQRKTLDRLLKKRSTLASALPSCLLLNLGISPRTLGLASARDCVSVRGDRVDPRKTKGVSEANPIRLPVSAKRMAMFPLKHGSGESTR
jgi:hypothetical protein